MAIYHCSIKIIGRSDGKSAVASSAYRSGEKLTDDRTGLIHDFTKKRGVVFTEVSLPAHAPPEYADRNVLWNAVEKAEKKSNAQLAREIKVALPKELSRKCQIEIVRRYVQENFVSVGMCADWALHDKGDGNPHAHIMLTMRGIKPDGSWAQKEKKIYALDEEGNRIPLIDPATGEQKLGKRNEKLWKRITVEPNDWNDQNKAEIWRKPWADICNEYLSLEQQIDHRSYKRQELDLEPTIHEGYHARKMEKAGFVSNRCEYNRIVRKLNELKAGWLLTMQALQKTIMERGRILYERIRKLMERRQSFETVGGLAGGERAVPITAGTKGDSDTDAFIRCAKSEITDMLHAIDDSRTRARDSEAERSYRQISRERLGIGRESETDRGEPKVVVLEYK